MDELIQQALGYLGTVLATLCVALATLVLRKIGISLDADRQAQLEYVVKQEVLRQEELAAERLKKTGIVTSGAEKLRSALEAVTDRLPRVDRDEAAAIVQAVLPQLGIGAAAGLRELGKALKTPAPKVAK